MSANLPDAVLFACSQNSIRSPMAESIMKHLFGSRVYVDSCGVFSGEKDDFVIAVMDEIGIDMTSFKSKTFDDMDDANFDLVVSLSPPAHHKAMELTRTNALEVEYWPTLDPSLANGSRTQILDSYRTLRDGIMIRIKQRFSGVGVAGV